MLEGAIALAFFSPFVKEGKERKGMLEDCDELVGFGSRIPLEFCQFPQDLAAAQRCTFCRDAGVCEVEVGFRMCMPLEFQEQETARWRW